MSEYHYNSDEEQFGVHDMSVCEECPGYQNPSDCVEGCYNKVDEDEER